MFLAALLDTCLLSLQLHQFQGGHTDFEFDGKAISISWDPSGCWVKLPVLSELVTQQMWPEMQSSESRVALLSCNPHRNFSDSLVCNMSSKRYLTNLDAPLSYLLLRMASNFVLFIHCLRQSGSHTAIAESCICGRSVVV